MSVLFDPGEQICASSTPYGTSILNPMRQSVPKECLFFSINPLHDDRRDSNVTSFRNILVEMDKLSLIEQYAYIRGKLPFTSCVYSGGKSLHFIISLQQPCPDEKTYRELVDRIYATVPECDISCKNPSRFSRLPGRHRPAPHQPQRLEYLGERINYINLEQYLPPVPMTVAPTAADTEPWTDTDLLMLINKAVIEPDKMAGVVGCSGRNAFFFWLGQRLIDAKFSPQKRVEKVESAYKRLTNKSKFSLREAKHAARIGKNT